MKFKSSTLHNQRIERITTEHLVVGVDIAKETHVARAVNYRGLERGRALSFTNNREGFERFWRWIKALQKEHQLSRLIVGLESTGHYWFALDQWLDEQGVEVVLVSPLTTKRNKENRDNRPSKNDAKDAITIAESVSRGFYSDVVRHEACYMRLRTLVNEREFWADKQAILSNRLTRELDMAFPEFSSVFKDWSCIRGIATLKAFTLPADIRALTVEQIIEGWKKHGMKRGGGFSGRQKAAELLAAARRSIGCTDVAKELKQSVLRLVNAFEHIQAQLAEIDRELQELMQEMPETAVKPFRSIGLSPFFTAVLLANTGDLSRFEHGRQWLALAGLSLSESTSGKRKGQIVLSKRGRRQLRKYLYLAVLGLVVNHPSFKQWHAHNVFNLKMKKQRSILKLIGKLARILVALARTQQPFMTLSLVQAA